ncbi:hypothetical protein SNEBB_003357, partial [Seison nebaliae]
SRYTTSNDKPNSVIICEKKCSLKWQPLCGSDNKMYHNRCLYEKAACQNKRLSVINLKVCLNEQATMKCPNFRLLPCELGSQSVCGSDRIWYKNSCFFLKQKCKRPELRLSTPQTCGRNYKEEYYYDDYYYYDDDYDYPQHYLHECHNIINVCANDAIVYPNLCDFQKMANKIRELKVVNSKFCKVINPPYHLNGQTPRYVHRQGNINNQTETYYMGDTIVKIYNTTNWQQVVAAYDAKHKGY